MEEQFTTLCRPSASSVEAWLFRKVFRAGSVVPNAIAAADVDGDGTSEILVGSTEGIFAILKPSRRTTLLSTAVPGTISALTAHDDAVYIVSMEGILTVLRGIGRAVRDGCSPETTHITIPANVTCIDVGGDYFVLGASDRKVHLLHMRRLALERSYFIGSQVFSVAAFEVHTGSGGSRALAFCAGTSHLAIVDPLASAATDSSLGPCAWVHGIDRNTFATERRGRVENPLLPVTAAAVFTEHASFVAAATEDGYCFMFTVGWDDTSRSVTVVPTWRTGGVRLGGGMQRVFLVQGSDVRRQCLMVALSNSGEVTALDDSCGAAKSFLIPGAGAFALLGVGVGDTAAIAAVTTEEISCFHIPLGALGLEGSFASTSAARCGAEGVTADELTAVGRLMFPEMHDQSDTFVANQAMRALLFGYSSSEWVQLLELRQAQEPSDPNMGM